MFTSNCTVYSTSYRFYRTHIYKTEGVFKTAALRDDSTVDLEEYASSVTGYISTCVENIVPTKRCRTYPNQKPWINCEVRSMLRARSTAFASGNAEDYKKARYDLRRSMREAKRQCRLKLEGFYSTADSRRMWQGLQHITDYQQRSGGGHNQPTHTAR